MIDANAHMPYMPDRGVLGELQAEAESLNQQLSAPVDRPDITGYDSTELIGITVNNAGAVQAVDVDDSWRRSIDPRELDAAVLEALDNVQMKRLGTWAETQELSGRESSAGCESSSAPGPTPASGVSTMDNELTPPPVDGPSTPEAQETITHVLELLGNVGAELDRFSENIREVATQPVTVTSVGGNVTITVVGGQPSTVDLDPGWASGARHTEISVELSSAVQAAQEAAQRARDSSVAGGSLGELQSLAGDPNALMRKLGLLR